MKIVRKTILDIDLDTAQTNDTDAIIKAVQGGAAAKTAKESADKNSFPLRPSSALKSERDLYYGLVNHYAPGTIPVTPIEGRSCMLLNLGHVIEKHLVEALGEVVEVPYRSQKIEYGVIKRPNNESIVLGGELDFVIKLESGELVLCDSKSSADFPFKKTDLPKDEHVAQMHCYLGSDFCRKLHINRCFLMYYNKNDSNIKVLEFNYDPRLHVAVVKRFQQVHDNYVLGRLPDAKYVLGVDWQSSYSNFRDYEWAPYEATKEERKLNNCILSTAAFPKAIKERLKFLVFNFGTDIVLTSDGVELWAEKVGSQMFLRETDKDGFSS